MKADGTYCGMSTYVMTLHKDKEKELGREIAMKTRSGDEVELLVLNRWSSPAAAIKSGHPTRRLLPT